jgi:tRNA1Val (adenine37-N6)-methyltransferase
LALDSWLYKKMSNDYFQFKQFIVRHDRCPMKVNTDGVLLGAWADVHDIRSALDVGTGSGIIALMIAQRSEANIDAVEIDHLACRQAFENIDHSPWKNRIKVHHDSFQHYASVCARQYDLIVSNPPYFRNAMKPGDKRKSKAKHDVDLGFEGLLYYSSLLLAPHGRFCVILPYAAKDNFMQLACINHLYCRRIAAVRSTPLIPFSRIIMAFSRGMTDKIQQSEITIHLKNREYSPEYIELTRDFYLAF